MLPSPSVWYQSQTILLRHIFDFTSAMPSRKGKETATSVDDWAELRQTLLAMHENLQTTLQDTIHQSMREVAATFL